MDFFSSIFQHNLSIDTLYEYTLLLYRLSMFMLRIHPLVTPPFMTCFHTRWCFFFSDGHYEVPPKIMCATFSCSMTSSKCVTITWNGLGPQVLGIWWTNDHLTVSIHPLHARCLTYSQPSHSTHLLISPSHHILSVQAQSLVVSLGYDATCHQEKFIIPTPYLRRKTSTPRK